MRAVFVQLMVFCRCASITYFVKQCYLENLVGGIEMKVKYIFVALFILLVSVVSCSTGGNSSYSTYPNSLVVSGVATTKTSPDTEIKKDDTSAGNAFVEQMEPTVIDTTLGLVDNTTDVIVTTIAASPVEKTPTIVSLANDPSSNEDEAFTLAKEAENSRIEITSSTVSQTGIAASSIPIETKNEENSDVLTEMVNTLETITVSEIADSLTNEKNAEETLITQEESAVVSKPVVANESESVSEEVSAVIGLESIPNKPSGNGNSEKTEDTPVKSESGVASSQNTSSSNEKMDTLTEPTVSNEDPTLTEKKSVAERDSLASTVFGGIGVIFLVVAIVLFRKKGSKRKISFIFFGIFIASFALYIVFSEHILCEHEWNEATCNQPQVCVLCGKTKGDALGHDFIFSKVTKEASCQEEGVNLYICSRCGETKEELMAKKDHVEGQVVTTKPASYNQSGTYSYYCKNCHEVYKTERFELSAAEKKKAFKEACNRYSYDSLARRPDTYKGLNVKLAGKVIQVMEQGNDVQLRVDITQEKASYSSTYFYDDTILVTYTKTTSERILEGDIVALYGVMAGNYTYTTVLGASLTVPLMNAKYIDRITDRTYNSI